MIICCDRCEHSFDAMDDRAWVPAKEDAGPLCPMCSTLVLHSSEGWAVWNDCNGAFEVMWRRADAERSIKAHYSSCEARAVPVRIMLEPEDGIQLRHWRESTDYS